MKRFIVDTNSFLRFLLNDIPHQKKAFETLLRKAKRKQILLLMPQIVVFELEFVLQKYYQFGKQEIITKLQTLVTTSYIEIESRNIFIAALQLHSNSNISFVDCFLIAKAREEDADLVTFDTKLQKLSRKQSA